MMSDITSQHLEYIRCNFYSHLSLSMGSSLLLQTLNKCHSSISDSNGNLHIMTTRKFLYTYTHTHTELNSSGIFLQCFRLNSSKTLLLPPSVFLALLITLVIFGAKYTHLCRPTVDNHQLILMKIKVFWDVMPCRMANSYRVCITQTP